jgi:hypothetical protein
MKNIAFTLLMAFLSTQSFAAPDQDEYAVTLVASIVALKNVCAQAYPSQAERYSKSVADDLDSSDAKEIMKSPLFSVKLKEAELKFKQLPNSDLAQGCESKFGR